MLILLSPEEMAVKKSLRERLREKYQTDLSDYDFRLINYLVTYVIARTDPRLTIVDLTDSLCQGQEEAETHYKMNSHWSVHGNSVVGKVLARFISQNWLTKEIDRNADFAAIPLDSSDRTSELSRQAFAKSFLDPILAEEGIAPSPENPDRGSSP